MPSHIHIHFIDSKKPAILQPPTRLGMDAGTSEGVKKAWIKRRQTGGAIAGTPYTKQFSGPAPEHEEMHGHLTGNRWKPEWHREHTVEGEKRNSKILTNASSYVSPFNKNRFLELTGLRGQWRYTHGENKVRNGFGASELKDWLKHHNESKGKYY